MNKIGSTGVKKKILSQSRVFAKHFSRVLIAYYANGMAYLYEFEIMIEKKLALSRMDCFEAFLDWMSAYQCKRVYMRCLIPASRIYIDFLRKMKANGIKAVLEYPTYPYEGEVKDEKILREDRFYRDEIKKYISLITTYSMVNNVYGIDTVSLQNGVTIEDNPVRNIREKSDTIVMLAVANFCFYHGYERVLEGMSNYYQSEQKYKIYFDMVGAGSERKYYEYLVKKYCLNDYVRFWGIRLNEYLTDNYNMADIGIAPLGMYKENTVYASPIKTREYCARGLPFIYGYTDTGFTGEEIFVSKVSNDSTPLDMNIVVELYERTIGRNDIIDGMRERTSSLFTWDILLQKVVDYLKY